MIYVIDNFVSTSYFHEIQEHIDSPWQEWYYQDNISFMEKKGKIGYFGFNQYLKEDNQDYLDHYTARLLKPLILLIQQRTGCKNLIRSRLDLTTYRGESKILEPHIDFADREHISTIFYIKDSDGNTVIYNEKYKIGDPTDFQLENLTIQKEIKPKANRLVIFDGLYVHKGHTPGEHNSRILLNSNFN